jgi:DnaJ-class molecular chaperone
MKIRTHYDNLKIDMGASQEEIKRAYRKLCAIHHPDKNPPENRERQNKIIIIINEAYNVLSDEKLKHEHDLWILSQLQNQSQEQNQSHDIYNDYHFVKVKEKTISVTKLVLVISLSVIILLIGVVLDKAFKTGSKTKEASEDLSSVFATSFNQEAKSAHLPVKVNAIISLSSYYAAGYKINYNYVVNAASSEISVDKIESNAYGKFRGNKICDTYELRQLPILISFSYHFSADGVTKGFIKSLAYLCGD